MVDRGTAGGQMTLESGGGLWRTAAGDFPIAGAGPGPNAPPPVVQPSAHCRIGAARRDVTPPVGIYNRNWGAAVSDVASGVHQAFYVTALAFAPLEPTGAAEGEGPLLAVTIDLGWLFKGETDELSAAVSAATGVSTPRLLISLSHTHAGPSMTRPFTEPNCPGGQLALAWWATLKTAAAEAGREALAAMQPAWLRGATGRCDLAQNRDHFDQDLESWVCGYNGDETSPGYVTPDDTLVACVAHADNGETLCSLCNYGCHPVCLGIPNGLLSPDWPGTCRETVAAATDGAPCFFMLGCCGDTNPMRCVCDDVKVAEAAGRRVGYAAAAALEGLLPAGAQLSYKVRRSVSVSCSTV